MLNSPINLLMNPQTPIGFYLLRKSAQEQMVLKDLLQLLRSQSPRTGHSFSYIEAKSSLHPQLSLWENLQLEVGHNTWREFTQSLKPEWVSLLNLIKSPIALASESAPWECFLISLLKGLSLSSQNLLIDMNEDVLSPFMIQQFKKCVLLATKEKTVYLASAHPSLWLDCAHTLVDRNKFQFISEVLDAESIKLKWAI